ncbi:DotU family type IV/VI secretion system protein [Collimonas antrihumi]|uniref:DotU family type IV/VI secretion system protein n=1 Tax=Collimonas antrihumi TaxID=1940615 RepID=UPI001FEBBF53|nr:DotU family type IV/VI secretion system protein [Collimonas antrihumi]
MTSSTSTATSAVSIRALLRDTALEVSLLAQRATPDSIEVLREDCQQLVASFEEVLGRQQVAIDVKQDALYAQCGLLDEMVLRHLPVEKKSEWDAEPLQVERFQNHDAGERIYERIAARMRETPPNLELLECYSTILGLGFKGRYARTGNDERTALMAALDAQIAKLRPMSDQRLIIDTSRTRPLDWLYRLSPWALAGFAAVATLLLYLLLGQSLDLQLSHLLQQKP